MAKSQRACGCGSHKPARNQVVFHNVSYIEVKPYMKDNSMAVELTDFSVFYNQDSIAHAESSLKNGMGFLTRN